MSVINKIISNYYVLLSRRQKKKKKFLNKKSQKKNVRGGADALPPSVAQDQDFGHYPVNSPQIIPKEYPETNSEIIKYRKVINSISQTIDLFRHYATDTRGMQAYSATDPNYRAKLSEEDCNKLEGIFKGFNANAEATITEIEGFIEYRKGGKKKCRIMETDDLPGFARAERS